MTINQRLKDVIDALGLNATELARDLNVTKSTISNVINGNSLPSSKVLMPLGEVFNVNINWLLLGQGEMFLNGEQSKINKTDFGNSRNSSCEDVTILKKEIQHLNDKLKDKEEIIRLMRNQK
jgi:transcriptional regulator with XRE-family HTH domain